MARLFVVVRPAGTDGHWQGRWIDIEDAGAGHPDTLVALAGRSREDWHVLAYEGLPDFGPHPDPQALLAYLDAVEDYGDAFEMLWASRPFASVLQAADAFADAFQGTYPDPGAWARDTFQRLGERLAAGSGFNAEAYVRKALAKGEVQFLPASGGGVHVFWCN